MTYNYDGCKNCAGVAPETELIYCQFHEQEYSFQGPRKLLVAILREGSRATSATNRHECKFVSAERSVNRAVSGAD